MPTHPPATPGPGRSRQTDIFIAGIAGSRPTVPVHPNALEAAARRALSPQAFAYVAGGAGAESTVRANRGALDRHRIVPRVLRDVSARDLSVELFGQRLRAPILLAPVGVLELAHAEADLAVARAAAAEGIPMVFSNQASVAMEPCAAAMGAATRWFQLYWSMSDDLVASFVGRAAACGCSAIVLTLDTTLLGWRPRDSDLAYLPFLRGKGIAQYVTDPVFRREVQQGEPVPGAAPPRPRASLAALKTLVSMAAAYPGGIVRNLRSGEAREAVRRFVAAYSRPSLTWADLPRQRDRTALPIVLKGIQHPDDARRAVDVGVDGIVVSNHGGRQIDGAQGSLDALPEVVGAVGHAVPVLFDSGIRGGADVFKALALGAQAVLLGRPYVYGLALAGETGVREVIRNVIAELDLTMGLAGCRSVAEIGPEALRAAP